MPCSERLRRPAERQKRKGKEKKRVTSLPGLCGSVLGGTVLRAGASGGQRGEEEGKRPLQAQSRTATAVLKDRGTPPSCQREHKTEFVHTELASKKVWEGSNKTLLPWQRQRVVQVGGVKVSGGGGGSMGGSSRCSSRVEAQGYG